jgi:hypothetical protein
VPYIHDAAGETRRIVRDGGKRWEWVKDEQPLNGEFHVVQNPARVGNEPAATLNVGVDAVVEAEADNDADHDAKSGARDEEEDFIMVENAQDEVVENESMRRVCFGRRKKNKGET